MERPNSFVNTAFLLGCALVISQPLNAQCTFSGLEASYCELDDPTVLVGDPVGGIFSGPGMTGSTFDPALAGPGTHTITYEMAGGGTGDKYYMKSVIGEPWLWGGGVANPTSMNLAFGPGGWIPADYETAVAATIFSPTTGFVFMEGGDNLSDEMNAFLTTNIALIESWVAAGGRLLMVAGPNEGGDINFGFDGTVCHYAPGEPTYVNNVTVVDPAHPALLGPNLPTSTAMSGTYYGHALILGTGYTNVLVDSDGPTRIVLAEKCWGSGRVMVGGMTTDNWHSPAPDAANFRANLYVYLYENACGGGCTYTQDVTVYATPIVDLTISETEICEGESVVLTGTGADTYTFDVPGIVSGASYTPPTDGTFNYTVTGTDAVSGCTSQATVSLTVHPTPVVTASSDDLEVCFGDAMTLTGGGASTYTWDHGVIDGVPFTPGPIGTTVYTVTGTSEFGCTASANISIDIIDCEPVDADFFFDNNICVGDCITLTDSSIGTTIVSYEWNFDGAVDPVTSTLQNPTVCFNTVGIYNISLTITSLYGQVSTETKTLTVNALPIISTQLDTIIELGGEANLIATCPSDGAYSWTPTQYIDCPECGITTASPEDSTMYTVTFIDENGCKDQDQVMVLVNFIKGVGLPTGFTPNGDGVNDILFIKGVGLAAVSLVVYNRYGEVVFETTDQNIGWDGTFKGRDENPGVFTWVLQYDFITGDRGIQKGNTTLIR